MLNGSKINFEDKTSNYINVNSQYVLTANEINEIKSVINNLISHTEENIFIFNTITKWLYISIPNKLLEDNIEYSITIELSNNKNFENSNKKDSKETNGFYKFENDKFIEIHFITKNDTKILIDISDLNIKNNKQYFIRYKFNNIQLIGTLIGSIAPALTNQNEIIYNKLSSDFNKDIKDIKYSLSTITDNTSITGFISASAEINENLSSINPNNFNIISLNDNSQNLSYSNGTFILQNINNLQILAISYNNYILPFTLNGNYIINKKKYKLEAPSELPFNTPTTISAYKIIDNNIINDINSNNLLYENLILSGNSLINDTADEYDNYKSISYYDKEILIKCSGIKLKNIIIVDKNTNNEIKILDVLSNYDYKIIAKFISNNKEFEIEIPNSDITNIEILGIDSNIISYTKSKIETYTSKSSFSGIINISFTYGKKIWSIQKSITLKGKLFGNIFGTIICSDNENRIEYPFNTPFIINELENGDDYTYTRNISINTNIDLHNKFFIGLENVQFDQNITNSNIMNLEFITSTNSKYNINVAKFENYFIPINIGILQKANTLSKISLTITFKGNDIL